jgi:hypothetical protein
MSYSLYILSNVPYKSIYSVEDNEEFLTKLLSFIGYVSRVHFFFCKESSNYKAYIKIKTKTVQQIKSICWRAQVYDIDNNCEYIDKIIWFEPCKELIIGEEYIFNIESFTDFINGTHKPWKGKIINFDWDEIIVEKEDSKEIERISLAKGKVYKQITFIDDIGQIIPTYLFKDFYYFS